LNFLRQQVAVVSPPLPQVTLLHRPAHDGEGIPRQAFDTVIINSVTQHFPSLDYLERVLDVALAALAPGGTIFLGDMRSLPLLEAFHASVQLYQAPASQPTAVLKQAV